MYLKSSVYTLSLHSFIYENACVYIQYISMSIYSPSSNTGNLLKFFEVPFTFLVPWGSGCLSSAPQPPSRNKTSAAVKLKGKPGNQWHQNLNAVPKHCTVRCHHRWQNTPTEEYTPCSHSDLPCVRKSKHRLSSKNPIKNNIALK